MNKLLVLQFFSFSFARFDEKGHRERRNYNKGNTYWSDWNEWSACDKPCGIGQMTRIRGCITDDADYTCPGGTTPLHDEETSPCNTKSCGQWSEWSALSECSETCWGTFYKTRTCEGGSICEGGPDGERWESDCNTNNCENVDTTGLCAPEGWKDTNGNTCQDYIDKELCTADGNAGTGLPAVTNLHPADKLAWFGWWIGGKKYHGGQCAQCGCRQETCATLYSAYPSFKNGDASVVANTGEVADLTSYKGEKWSNRVSYVQIEPNCVFEGFQDPNFDRLLGRWRGQINSTNSYEMDAKYENNKMKSFKCSCQENQTCVDHYMFGTELQQGCLAPVCDVVETQVFDSWKKKRGEQFRYGFALKIAIPEEYWGKGWSVLLRFNSAKVNSGNFQLWNANFFNIFRKPNGLEVLIHQKYYTANDLTDPHSFVIVAEQLTTSLIPEVYFWSHRNKRHQCFDSNMQRSSSTAFDRAIKSTPGIKDIEEISQIKINAKGNIRVKR